MKLPGSLISLLFGRLINRSVMWNVTHIAFQETKTLTALVINSSLVISCKLSCLFLPATVTQLLFSMDTAKNLLKTFLFKNFILQLYTLCRPIICVAFFQLRITFSEFSHFLNNQLWTTFELLNLTISKKALRNNCSIIKTESVAFSWLVIPASIVLSISFEKFLTLFK